MALPCATLNGTLPRPGVGTMNASPAAPAARLALLVLAVAVVVPSRPALAEVYRWVDEEGVTVFSQRPPPVGAATQVRTPAGPSEAERQAAQARLRGLAETSVDRRDDRGNKDDKAAKEKQVQAKKDADCDAARKNLDTLINHGKGRIKKPDGTFGYLGKDELAGQIEAAKAQIAANCK
jgi:hypothetical protein